MSPQTTEVVDRMYEVLVDEIRSRRPELLDEPFTVAEIYQNLVPYRTHRDRIGTEMNGDYEHALLRLLAGAGDYVKLESDTARRRFEEELESVHPDTGIYRNFAACELRLNPDRLPPEVADEAAGRRDGDGGGREGTAELRLETGDDGETPTPAGPDPDAASPDSEARAEEAAAEAAPDEPPGPEAEEERPPEADESVCRWCRERLPERDDLQFCPFCGSRVDLVPCPDCGTELEEGWLFCVSCGSQVGG